MDKPPSENLPNIASALADRILNVLNEVDEGFRKVMWMYLCLFYLGLLLIVLACVGSLVTGNDKIALVFGGVGLADVIAFLAFKPVEDLQRSRGNLSQLVSAFLTWYNDTHNWNQVSLKLLQADGAINLRAFKIIPETQIANTIALMSAIELVVASKDSRSDTQLVQLLREIKTGSADVAKVSSEDGPEE